MATLDRCAHEGGPHPLDTGGVGRRAVVWHWIRSVGKVVQRDEAGQAADHWRPRQDITEVETDGGACPASGLSDALTGLPNRRLLNDRLSQAMAASKRSGRYGALMFLRSR